VPTKKLLVVFGEICLTVAALIFAFLAYQLWFTNVSADIKASEMRRAIEAQLDLHAQSTEADTEVYDIPLQPGEGLGLLYIPKLSDRVWGLPIVSGTADESLSLGVGHYSATEYAGEEGNFALAGHRATNGEPFANFERLAQGDMVYIRTEQGWFGYELFQDQKIPETAIWVLNDAPNGIASGSKKLLTLTTCDPRWNSTQRWAWWGELTYESSEPPRDFVKP